MYPRLWVPQLRAHILSNFAWNTALLVGLPMLYVLLPQIVATGHGYLRGSGYVPTEFEQRVFEDHWKIMAYSALVAFGVSEVQGYYLRRMRAAPFESFASVRGSLCFAERCRNGNTPKWGMGVSEHARNQTCKKEEPQTERSVLPAYPTNGAHNETEALLAAGVLASIGGTAYAQPSSPVQGSQPGTTAPGAQPLPPTGSGSAPIGPPTTPANPGPGSRSI
jgi:hypothetical protein